MAMKLVRQGAKGSRRLLCALLGALALAAGGLEAAERPNIVYILADDLGWNDVGFHGGAIRTPNLDRLAASGAVLNALYAQPFSTPDPRRAADRPLPDALRAADALGAAFQPVRAAGR